MKIDKDVILDNELKTRNTLTIPRETLLKNLFVRKLMSKELDDILLGNEINTEYSWYIKFLNKIFINTYYCLPKKDGILKKKDLINKNHAINKSVIKNKYSLSHENDSLKKSDMEKENNLSHTIILIKDIDVINKNELLKKRDSFREIDRTKDTDEREFLQKNDIINNDDKMKEKLLPNKTKVDYEYIHE
ncbi:hypothetical protein MKS88_003494 [Plasmodium brasilianum]|uniref:Uncharacterized protein n=1 Tax=Plasmodium brasilianum TaxID=5824 RepID=A0ACB9Y7C1_PLABR|nr:hypothetical protein MKS88_003494 [Plasmodium brasilianum]